MAEQLIPAALVAALEAQTAGRLSEIKPRAGGGASRQGAEVTLTHADGRAERGYLSYDSRTGDPERKAFFRREVAVLAALSGPLADCGVRAPRYLASDLGHLALLTELTPGSDRFHAITDVHEREAVAQDFIGQLAALHRIDARARPLDGFGDPQEPPSAHIRRRIAELRAENLATAPDPILQLALNWLERNVPKDAGPSALVHGDAGPGNFLHQDGRVTALLDWELTHYGDPAEDLAQILVRMLFQPFIAPRALLDAYEVASGLKMDLARIRYHRLYFQAGFTTSSHPIATQAEAPAPALLGIHMIFYTAHMRVMVRSLAELMEVELEPVQLPQAAADVNLRTYDIALDDLRDVILPRTSDQQAEAKAKSLARLVKYWRARALHGAAFDAAELSELASALGAPVASVAEGRRRLALAVADRTVDAAHALQLCHARMARETVLMGDAMGAFRDVYFQPIT